MLLSVCWIAGAFALTGSVARPTAATAEPGSDLTFKDVDGGVDYYARFSRPLPSDPSYFPIGAWLKPAHSQAEIDDYRDFGLNLFVGMENPEMISEALIRSNGMKAIVQADERTRFDDIGSETAGWLLADEIDMTHGPAACHGLLQTIESGLPADDRARYNNYGKGVLLWETDAQAACFVEAQQLVSSDLYWFTDPNQIDMIGETWLPEGERQMALAEVRRAANYGYQIDRMRALDAMDGHRKPIWAFVELGWPFTESADQGGRRILPAELRAAVWHSIIAGARGVIYFDHNFGPGTPDSTIRGQGYEDTRVVATSVNHQIEDLAPVLNGPTVTSGWTASSSIRAMVKWHAGHLYVFAGSRENRSSTGTISIPCVGDATAVRLGQAGSVPVSAGSFSDSFADGNAIHIYRINGGSTCGQPTVNTRITSGPRGRTKDRTPTFGFDSDQPGATFECRIDSKPFHDCDSPFTAVRLSLGKHRFRVRGVSPHGPDPTPAKRKLKVVKRKARAGSHR